jgi:hypothetical protein
MSVRVFDSCRSAASKGANNSRFWLATRRRIPVAAFGLKKYLHEGFMLSSALTNKDLIGWFGADETGAIAQCPATMIPPLLHFIFGA